MSLFRLWRETAKDQEHEYAFDHSWHVILKGSRTRAGGWARRGRDLGIADRASDGVAVEGAADGTAGGVWLAAAADAAAAAAGGGYVDEVRFAGGDFAMLIGGVEAHVQEQTQLASFMNPRSSIPRGCVAPKNNHRSLPTQRESVDRQARHQGIAGDGENCHGGGRGVCSGR